MGQWIAQTLDLTARLVPCEAGSLLLDDPAQKQRVSPLTFVAAFGPTSDELIGMQVPAGEGIVGHVYSTGRTYTTDRPRQDPHYYPRVDQIGSFRARSVLAVPVRLENHVCGVFELVNRRGPVGFSERDLQVAELLTRYVSRAILNAVDILKQNELALHDDLTGMRNVRGLDAHVESAANEATEAGEDLAILFVDVNRLKSINDEFGHAAGSATLQMVGDALRHTLGHRGVAFRFGGDEFVLVCPRMGPGGAEALGDELRASVVEATRELPHGRPPVQVSVGVATLKTALEGDVDAGVPLGTRLLSAADKALYRAKGRGRNTTAVASRRDDTLRRRS